MRWAPLLLTRVYFFVVSELAQKVLGWGRGAGRGDVLYIDVLICGCANGLMRRTERWSSSEAEMSRSVVIGVVVGR